MSSRLREQILAAAAELTSERGWSEITMSRLAQRVGVSRQTIYNEIGTKADLAEAVVMNEMLRFLFLVETAFDTHPDDLVEAIRMAVRTVLELGEVDPMLNAAMAANHGAASDLLPLLTTNATPVLEAALESMLTLLAPYQVQLEPDQMRSAVDSLVRVMISRLMQPNGTPEEAGDAIAWIASLLLPVASPRG